MSMLTPPGMGGKYRIKGDRYPRMRRSRGRAKIIFASVASAVAIAMIGWGTLQLIDIFSGGSGPARAAGPPGAADCPTPTASRDAAAAENEHPDDSGRTGKPGKTERSADKSGDGKDSGSGKGGKNGGSAPEGKLPAPRTITVNVLNATSRAGLAQATADALEERGFKIGKVGNAPADLDKKVKKSGVLVGSPGAATSARMKVLGTQLDGAGTTYTERDSKDVDLVIGDGFKKLTKEKAATSALAKLNKPEPSHSASDRC